MPEDADETAAKLAFSQALHDSVQGTVLNAMRAAHSDRWRDAQDVVNLVAAAEAALTYFDQTHPGGAASVLATLRAALKRME